MKIKAEVKSIDKLKDYFFIVPDYQREYVWKADDQIEQFLNDIADEYDPHAKQQTNYFIGSIIIVKNSEKYDVIDGQQRLTTIVISLCALRDVLQECGENGLLTGNQPKLLDSVKEWLSNYDLNTDQIQPRLELQYEESSDYLLNVIEQTLYQGEITPSIDKMQQAFECISSHFSEYKMQSINALIAYARYFLTAIDLVVIESEDLSSALKIFETINQRGASLNAMDLVKNLMFSKARETQFVQIKSVWKEINRNLQSCEESDNPLRFLRYFMTARYHQGILREDELYKWIISPEGKASLNYENEPLKLVQELQYASKRYSALVLATNRLGDGTDYPHITNIGYINKYRSRQHLVLLMALDLHCPNNVIDYLGAQLESFFFFVNSMGIQTKTYEQRFSSWAVKLRGVNTKENIDVVVQATLVPFILKRLPDFYQAFSQINHTTYNPQYRQRFILGCIENEIRRQCGLPILSQLSIQNFQIEHILPQTVKNYENNADFSDPDVHNRYVYRLGNVTLLEGMINQAVNNCNDLSTEWFTQKQQEYIKSDSMLTRLMVADFSVGHDTAINRLKNHLKHNFTEWTQENIMKRQQIFMELALDYWRFCNQRIDQYSTELIAKYIE
ncbi:DUF262 domain-containing protein [Morganella morganii]|uniref:DUF262 domain-containing protein n=1 Tax=Morganella morganii TaxID=582 RepID=UPI0025A6BDF1|nr:DUF262 domain-containing protein [Morganella morganii]EKW5730859.1 DUF262 domain-containing protein [Morganella morganii]